jgi:hypothetical protein
MPDDGPAFEFEVKIQRGNGTDDRDTYKTKVSAETIDELDEKVEQARDKLEEWGADFREIQPQDTRTLADDQATPEGGEAGD